MKNIFVLSFLLILCSAPWACDRHIPVIPTPIATPTPTPTVAVTPNCTFTLINLNTYLTPTATPNSSTGWTTSPPAGTPVTFTGQTRVLRTLSDWQSYYGTQTPPVDFSQQMLLQAYLLIGCITPQQINSACESATQVTVNILQGGTSGCLVTGYSWATAAVPQSNLPIVWQVYSNP